MFSRFIIVGLLLLVTASVSVAAVPNNIRYQGYLTDALGDPVADGPYNIKVVIWDHATFTGALYEMWNSGLLSVNTTDGLFSATLGEAPQPPIPAGLFSDPTLWLGLTIAGDPEISPRTELTSVPYALSAGGGITDHGALNGLADDDHSAYVNVTGDVMTGALEHQNAVSNWTDGGTDAITIDPGSRSISTYGDAGGILSETFDNLGFGEIKLYRQGLADERVHILTTAGTGSQMKLWGTVEDPPFTNGIHMIGGDGSRMFMYDQIGNFQMGFDMLSTIDGNSKVNLPDSAVAADEILDEPGLSHEFTNGPWTATSGTDVAIDSVSVTVPNDGFVLVLVNGYIESDHITGTNTTGRVWVSESGSIDFDNFHFNRIPSVLPTATYYESFTLSMVKDVVKGNSYKFRVRADRFSGDTGADAAFSRVHTTAIYFPTNYGDVTITKQDAGLTYDRSDDPSGLQAPRSTENVITVKQHQTIVKARLEEQQRQMEERMQVLEDRLGALEEK